MRSSRRNFIKSTAGLSAISLLPSFVKVGTSNCLPNAPRQAMPSGEIVDENFWCMLRLQFPLGTKRIYFNNGTMGPSPYPVIDAVHQKMAIVDGTGEYGGWEESRKVLAEFVKVNEDEICLTHNVTEGINIICWGLDLKKGDEILLTNHEHVGGALPWLNRAKLQELKVDFFMLGATAAETISNLKKKVSAKTRVIAIPHIVCTIGQIQPIKEIITWAKTKNIEVFVDGAHGAGMLDLDLHDLGCDFYASCCHKWMCGPKGTAFLYVKKEALERLPAHYVGAGSDTGWNIVDAPKPGMKGYSTTAHRFDYGTQNAALWAGVNASVQFMNTIGMKNVEARVKELTNHFRNGLESLKNKNITIITSDEPNSRAAVTALKLANVEYTKLATEASNADFRIRSVAENGVNCVRISTHIYNSKAEIDKLVDFIGEMANKV